MANNQLVCIGTSTGGPKALQYLLPQFPKNLPAPILIVQHMPPVFTKLLAERLDKISQIHVKEAEHGEAAIEGTAYIAPGGYHMTVAYIDDTLKIQLDESKPVKGHRPSVDRLFCSLLEAENFEIITVLLTGMGSDGTNGLKRIKMAHPQNVRAIAEAEKSCIVFGMPKAAIQANIIDEIVELEKIFETIMKHVQ